jgi:peroxiredoxin
MNNGRWVRIAVAVALVAMTTGCRQSTGSVGTHAPEFMLEDMQGVRFYLSACRGNVVLLNFWSVYCVPCVKEVPELGMLDRKYKGRGLVTAGICTDPGDKGSMERFLAPFTIDYPVCVDNSGDVARRYRVKAVPVTVLIDKTGTVRYRWTGYTDGYAQSYARAVELLLGE